MPISSRLFPLLSVIVIVFIVLAIHRWPDLNQRVEKFSCDEVKDVQLSTKSNSIFDSVRTMVLFIGYPRSSHTLVASLLDAHPNCIVSNEYNVIKRWKSWPGWKKEKHFLFKELYNSSYKEAMSGYRAALNPRGFFGYHVPNQWQGKFDKELQVIGDKNGGKTTQLLTRFKMFPEFIDMKNKIGIPIKVLHLVRNPFDNIATMVLRKLQLRKDITSAVDKVDDERVLRQSASWYFHLVEMNAQLHQRIGHKNILDLNSEDVAKKPKEILTQICTFLDLSCSKDYLEDCASLVHSSTTHTRDYIKWPKELVEDIEKKISEYEFLSGYTFTS